MNDGYPFTPRLSHNASQRLEMRISIEDVNKLGRGKDWSATVTNLKDGRQYNVEGADCGADCFCDAVIQTPPHPQSKA